MIKQPAPYGHTLRLQSVHSLKILDAHPQDRFDRLTRLAARVFNVPMALVSLVDKDSQLLRPRRELTAHETSGAISFRGQAIVKDEIFIVEDALEDERFGPDNPLVAEEPEVRFYAGYPLKSPDGHRLGTLCIMDRVARKFAPEEAEMLQEMGQLVEAELISLTKTTTDELTRITNRRGFLAIAAHVLAICTRAEKSVALLMFDLDGFKEINDQFGHQAGDKALIDFAKMLLKNFREADLVARLGGDEFCVLCTGFSKINTGIVLQRLQEKLDVWNVEPEQKGKLAFSAGAVEFDPKQHATIEDLMHAADEVMYVNKRGRRQSRRAGSPRRRAYR
jgi:diguanylate cyclase (GGDEF)-like protein